MHFIYFSLIICLNDFAIGLPIESANQMAVSNNYFGLNLLKKLSQINDENVFISPFSISSALGMLFLGTKEKTAQEFRQVLGYELSLLNDTQVRQESKNLLEKVLERKKSMSYELDVANGIITQDKYPILDSYKSEAQKYFNASIYSTDFARHGNDAMQMINDWVKKQTHEKIDRLLSEPLDPSVILVLLNAIYFKGTWKIQFNKEITKEENFFGIGERVFRVPLMHVLENFNYTHVSQLNGQLLELPYAGNDISMYILLPYEKEGLKQVKKSLNSNHLDEAIGRMYETKVEVAIPKFKFSTKYHLIPQLQSLGIQQVFSSKADLSGIDGRKDLYVSDVIHKAIIEVNEEGSEAAAVTDVIISRHGPNVEPMIPSFRADHPFAFFIRDNRNGLILFEGQVNQF
jgi:serine protease inhibitor